jgi:hypothetical protein
MWDFDDYAEHCFDCWDAMEDLNIERDMVWDDEFDRWIANAAETGVAFG